jgi:hypothetical protein
MIDRASLEAAAARFLEGLAAHDPGSAGLAPAVRYTENGQELAIGDGLWGTISKPGVYRHVIADPETGQVGLFATVHEHVTHSILTVRLKVEAGGVSEIETIVSRPTATGPMAQGAALLDQRAAPESVWHEEVAAPERMSRADLARIADMYFAGLEKNDGKGDYPFADDCERIENGYQTTNQAVPPDTGIYMAHFMTMSCRAQFETGFFRFVDRIRDRRFPVIDVERGAVFAFGFFDHSGTVPEVTLTSGEKVEVGLRTPFTWEIGEAFKIEKGLIRRIEAAMTQAPYGMRPNWPD